MRKNELLQDAIGLIGDDLIMDAKTNQKRENKHFFPKIAAAAACVGLLVGGWLLLTKQEATPTEPLQNLWEREGFQAYSLVYSNAPASQALSFEEGPKLVFLSQTETVLPTTTLPEETVPPSTSLPEETVTAAPILLSSASTIKVESLIGGRYAAYISNTGAPIFFDTQEGVSVDLKQRILGETALNPDDVLALVVQAANELYPGMLESESNREYLFAYIKSLVYETPIPQTKDWQLDTSFMDDLSGYEYTSDEDRLARFGGMCWNVYMQTLRLLEAQKGEGADAPYRVKILSIDANSGKCIVQILDAGGQAESVQLYDMVTDTVICTLPNGTWQDSSIYYSPDGKNLTVAFCEQHASAVGPVISPDYTLRHEAWDTRYGVGPYNGEEIYAVNCETAEQYTVSKYAASQGFLSKSGKVCYFKRIPPESSGKGMWVSGKVWQNRLTLFNRDTDTWVFCTATNWNPYGEKTSLQGNFVRFMADETVAVMERGGQYYAYLLGANKQDITQQLQQGEYAVAPHERLRVFCENGHLFKQDMFSGEPAEVIAPADQYVLSSDGAFAFGYVEGSSYAMCYNVATLECCAITLDPQLCSQLLDAQGAVFRMVYNDTENTLTLSFYLEEDVADAETVDFFSLLAQLDENAPATRYTEYQVSQALMDKFRQSAYKYDHPDGILTWDAYYPEGFPLDLRYPQVFEALGIAPGEDCLDINGTVFVLYDSGGEQLMLTFYDYWGLYNYTGHDRGFYIQYYRDGRTYHYNFCKLD